MLDQLREVVEGGGKPVLVDNIEVLFHPDLKANPLSLLRRLSRDRTLVAAWGGSLAEGRLKDAARGHPEYRRYDGEDFLSVNLNSPPAAESGL